MGLIIAVDGPGGAGKGTICQIVSGILKCPYLDTGLMYRSVAAKLIHSCSQITESKAIEYASSFAPDYLEQTSLRNPKISDLASKIAVIPEVRQRLLNFQIDFAKDPRGAILDGRDIGANVCPKADLKFFITASLNVRAKRRWTELLKLNPSEDLQKVTLELRERDLRDSTRVLSPLIKAEDALLIDTSELTIDAAVKLFMGKVFEKINKS